jgi:carboxyl-terminal processing protease
MSTMFSQIVKIIKRYSPFSKRIGDVSREISINKLLSKLKDGHSYYSSSTIQKKLSTKKFYKDPSWKISKGVGYLTIPGFVSTNKQDLKRFASKIAEALEAFRDHDVDKIVIDLRKNFGGNMWPAIHGLSSLFDKKSTIGGFKIEGKTNYFTAYGKNKRVPCKGKNYAKSVEIRVGRGTASSGEIIAAVLTMLPKSKLKGTRTGGYMTVNRSFKLKNGWMLALMVGTFVNGRGRSIGTKLVPKSK